MSSTAIADVSVATIEAPLPACGLRRVDHAPPRVRGRPRRDVDRSPRVGVHAHPRRRRRRADPQDDRARVRRTRPWLTGSARSAWRAGASHRHGGHRSARPVDRRPRRLGPRRQGRRHLDRRPTGRAATNRCRPRRSSATRRARWVPRRPATRPPSSTKRAGGGSRRRWRPRRSGPPSDCGQRGQQRPMPGSAWTQRGSTTTSDAAVDVRELDRGRRSGLVRGRLPAR